MKEKIRGEEEGNQKKKGCGVWGKQLLGMDENAIYQMRSHSLDKILC